MRRHTFAMLASAALVAGCSQDEAVTAQGGGAFEASFAAVTPVRTPTITAQAYGRTVNNAAVVDSIVGEVALTKQLDGRARYQFYVVNGLDSSATPVSHRQWIVRTDSILDANGNITSPIDTNRSAGVRDFWRGGFFGQKLRFAVTLSATDSVHQRAAWLVLTIQADSTSTKFNDSTPRPLFVRFRDQKGTATRDDDAVFPDTLRGAFGDFLSPARQTTFTSAGTGTLLFWDVVKTGKPAIARRLRRTAQAAARLLLPAVHRRRTVGQCLRLGRSVRPRGEAAVQRRPRHRQHPADVARGAAAERRHRAGRELHTRRPDSRAEDGRAAAQDGAVALQRDDGATRRDSRCVESEACSTGHGAGDRDARDAGWCRGAEHRCRDPGPGLNFNTLLGNKNTDSTGTARFTNVPVGEVRVIAIPFGGSIVDSRATVTSGQTTTIRLVVP